MTIDLNCDLGESFGPWEMGNDADMIDLATSVNIACGFHAGDADIMRKTVELAKARDVSIGAHPGYLGDQCPVHRAPAHRTGCVRRRTAHHPSLTTAD